MKQIDRKQDILDVAVEMIARKGIEFTIAEIAAAADVTDSVLYHYYKNKEDLLFQAAGEHLKAGVRELSRHLKGITEPTERLRKFIWFQLFYHDTNSRYADFTIFECRSKIQFFSHDSFQYFREWSRLLREILEDGQKAGAFPDELNLLVVRDMILGLLDMENILYLTGLQKEDARKDLDEIWALLNPLLTDTSRSPADKYTRIWKAAEEVFAREGFDHATISEISRAARVAEGTIYDFFPNKQELLFSIMRARLGQHLNSLEELFSVKTPLRKLRRFVRHHYSVYLSRPAFTKAFILNGIFNREFYQSDVYSDFVKYLHMLDRILDEGKSDGSIRSSVNNRIFRNLFVGAFSHLALRWLVVGKAARFDKTAEINEVVELLTTAVALR
ncbi:MAG: TetR/AcrR family transcriptional regulator [Thermodesulfobacteriota bacterium]